MSTTVPAPAPADTPPAAIGLLTAALAGQGVVRTLGDLVAAADAGAAWLVDPGAAADALDRGQDPVLYRAWPDVLPARTATTSGRPVRWHADLVVYPTAVPLPGAGELPRSIGHWNTPTQVEVFQVLAGRVLMLHTDLVDGIPTMVWQSCGAGEHVSIPAGAWHLTAVLAAPAAVFNIYTGAEPTGDGAPAALPKYHRAAPPHLTVTSRDGHLHLTGDPTDHDTIAPDTTAPDTTAAWPVHYRTTPPDWAPPLAGQHGLTTLYCDEDDTALAQLHDHARRHAGIGAGAPETR